VLLGEPAFDVVFSLVVTFGVILVPIAAIFRLLR
jgi:hypothetical protein